METNEILQEIKTSGNSLSIWTESTEPIRYEQLLENIKTDVVIVGGGIAGVSIAYNLLLSGKKVVIVEDGFIGSGETGRTTAHLVTALDDRYYIIEQQHGKDGAKLAAESHAKAIDFIEETIKKENIDCDFERLNGYLFLHPTDKKDSIDKEFEAAKRAGLKVEKLDFIPGLKHDPAPCIVFPNQAQFHILKYIAGVCHSIVRLKGEIYTETRAEKIDHTGVVTNKGFKIEADHVVVGFTYGRRPVNTLRPFYRSRENQHLGP